MTLSMYDYKDAIELKSILQVQFEVISNQRDEIQELEKTIRHLESLLFSRAVLINDKPE